MSVQSKVNALIGSIAQSQSINQLVEKYSPDKAMGNMRYKGQQQLQQKRNFKEYLIKASAGNAIPFSSLGKDAQKYVMQSYSSKDRQKLMNQIDMEHGRK